MTWYGKSNVYRATYSFENKPGVVEKRDVSRILQVAPWQLHIFFCSITDCDKSHQRWLLQDRPRGRRAKGKARKSLQARRYYLSVYMNSQCAFFTVLPQGGDLVEKRPLRYAEPKTGRPNTWIYGGLSKALPSGGDHALLQA